MFAPLVVRFLRCKVMVSRPLLAGHKAAKFFGLLFLPRQLGLAVDHASSGMNPSASPREKLAEVPGLTTSGPANEVVMPFAAPSARSV